MASVSLLPERVATTLDVGEARAIVERIRLNVMAALVDVGEAWKGRAWVALGYESWEDLCKHEFAEFELPRLQRQAAVLELRAAGMSTRAISAAIGTSTSTVQTDLVEQERSQQVSGNCTPKTVTGTDGKSYPAIGNRAGRHVEQIHDMARLGLNGSAIAEALDISEGRVSQIARAAGIVVGTRSSLAKAQRVERTRVLANEGATSQQIADELGVSDLVIRRYAREHNIAMTADAMTRVRNMSSVRIVTAAIDVLDGIDVMFDHIDYTALSAEDVNGWISVLDTSIRSLTNLRKHLKELTQP